MFSCTIARYFACYSLEYMQNILINRNTFPLKCGYIIITLKVKIVKHFFKKVSSFLLLFCFFIAKKPNSLNTIVENAQKIRKISYKFQLIFSKEYCIIKTSSIKYRLPCWSVGFPSADARHLRERKRIYFGYEERFLTPLWGLDIVFYCIVEKDQKREDEFIWTTM